MLLCWCGINAAKDSRCILEAAGSVQACVFVSWHSRGPCMHCHTWICGDCCPVCSAPAESQFLHPPQEMSSHHDYGMNVAKKRREGVGQQKTNCRSGGEERKVASCLAWKERGCTSTRMRGRFDLQLPPRWSAGVWSWLLPGVESSGGALTPDDLRASTVWPGSPGCAPCTSVMQSILVRIRQQMSLPVGSI